MKFSRASESDLMQLMAWFQDEQSCRSWGGPQFRYPFSERSFLEDTRADVLPSYVLTENVRRLLAFGQYYERVGRCHLGRLVVSPRQRGRGLGRALIVGLVERGVAELEVTQCSLFVAPGNLPAVRLYEKLGFERTPYPENDPTVAGSGYMVVPVQQLLEGGAA